MTFTHTHTHVKRRSFLTTILSALLLVCLFPALAFAWPLDGQWITLTRSYSGLTDRISDSQGGANDPRDIVTNDPAYPAAYVFNDGTYMYYRIRVDGNALNNQGNGLQPFGWGFVIDTDNDFSDYEWLVMLNGISNPETIILGQNTVQSALGDPSDKTELTVWSEQWMLNVNFRSVPADSFTNGGQDYFLDFRIPYATFKAKTGLTDSSPIRYFIGSSNNAQSLVADLVDISNICVPATITQCMPANATDPVIPLGTYPTTGTVRFVTGLTSTVDLDQIYSGQTLYIRVADADLNTNSTLAQTVQVTVAAQTGDNETVTLTETGPNTGIFTGSLPTSGGSPVSGVLQVAAIETVTVTYVDAVDASFNTNQNRTDTLTVQKAADLAIAKSSSTATPAEGATVVYTLTVTNNGPDSATGIQVTDNLPAGVTWASDSGAGAYNRTTGVWEVPALATGASTTLSISVTVNAGTSGSTITNTAAITASAVLDPVSGNNSASRSVAVGGADLAVAKTVNNVSPPTGGSAVFTVVLRNLGSSLATGVTVTDTLSSGLTYSTSSATQGSFNSGTGTWTVGSLASGTTATLTLTATVTGAMGTTATNTAAVATSSQVDPNTANNAETVTVFISGTDLSMAKTVSNAAPNEGNTIVYTLSVTNGGLYTATSVTVSDLLPAGLTYVSSAGTGTYASGTGLWSIPALNSGATVTRTITATVNAGTNGQTITNTASITGSSLGDPNAANNSASAALTVQRADLSLTKTSSNPSPNKNQSYSYTVALRNLGPHSATTITVRDVIDTGNITYNSASATGGSVAYAAPTLTWSVPGPLVSGATVTLTINVTVNNNVSNGVTIQNMAEITGAAQADPVNANNQSIVPVVVGVGSTDIAVAKSVSTTAPSEGGTVTYTVVVSNVSPTQATNVTIGDALPGGLTYFAGGTSVTQGTYNSGSGVWTVGTLNSGATATMLLAATVNAGTTGWTITNTATLTGVSQIDVNPANDTASATLVVGATDLAVTKTVNNPAPNVGSTVVYTVGLRNNGPNNATAITVTDLLPAGLTFVSSATTTGIYTSGTGSWSIATLNTGATATLTLNATVSAGTAGTMITNTATRTAAAQPDNVTSNDSASASVTVQSADVAVTKTADNLTPQELSPVAYTVTVTNNGPHDATNVVIQDLLSSNLTYSTHVVSQGTYSAATGIWTVGSVAKSTTKTLQITARPNLLTAGTNIVNTAAISAADQADPAAGNNSASITITPVALAVPNIVVLKSSATTSDPYNGATNPKNIPGAIVEYTITVTNFGSGATDSDSVYVIDPIPANTELFVNDIGAGYGPVAFVDGSPSSGLTFTYASLNDPNDGLQFSKDGGSSFGASVTADGNGCDSQVTHIRYRMNGAFGFTAGAPRPSFTVRFRVRVK